MDPNATHKELKELATKVRADYEDHVRNGVDQDDADRLAQLVLAMDEHLANGGFLPTAWQFKTVK